MATAPGKRSATVEEVLPGLWLGREDAAAEIRIRHLLTHTSGIDGDIFADSHVNLIPTRSGGTSVPRLHR